MPDKWNHNQFYEMAMQPAFGDTMAYQLTRDVEGEPEERTFSEEGIDGIVEQFRYFMLARLYSRYKATGKGPRKLRATISLTWDTLPENSVSQVHPWFALKDQSDAFTQVDGLHRLPLDKRD